MAIFNKNVICITVLKLAILKNWKTILAVYYWCCNTENTACGCFVWLIAFHFLKIVFQFIKAGSIHKNLKSRFLISHEKLWELAHQACVPEEENKEIVRFALLVTSPHFIGSSRRNMGEMEKAQINHKHQISPGQAKLCLKYVAL